MSTITTATENKTVKKFENKFDTEDFVVKIDGSHNSLQIMPPSDFVQQSDDIAVDRLINSVTTEEKEAKISSKVTTKKIQIDIIQPEGSYINYAEMDIELKIQPFLGGALPAESDVTLEPTLSLFDSFELKVNSDTIETIEDFGHVNNLKNMKYRGRDSLLNQYVHGGLSYDNAVAGAINITTNGGSLWRKYIGDRVTIYSGAADRYVTLRFKLKDISDFIRNIAPFTTIKEMTLIFNKTSNANMKDFVKSAANAAPLPTCDIYSMAAVYPLCRLNPRGTEYMMKMANKNYSVPFIVYKTKKNTHAVTDRQIDEQMDEISPFALNQFIFKDPSYVVSSYHSSISTFLRKSVKVDGFSVESGAITSNLATDDFMDVFIKFKDTTVLDNDINAQPVVSYTTYTNQIYSPISVQIGKKFLAGTASNYTLDATSRKIESKITASANWADFYTNNITILECENMAIIEKGGDKVRLAMH